MLSNIEKALFLKSVNLFKSMPPDQLKILTNISEEVNFQEGEILFNENDPPDYLYVIVDGEIRIIKNFGTSEELCLSVLHPRASFGELSLFGDEGRSATAVASKDSTFLAIEKDHLLLLIKENPNISTTILFQLVTLIREFNRNLPSMQEEELPTEMAPREAGVRGEDLRQDPRFVIPGIVDVPILSPTPITLDNISASGIQITVPRKPALHEEIPISLKIGDLSLDVESATVVWSQPDNSRGDAWKVGMKIKIAEEKRKILIQKLEENPE